jgi:hypothetical protein
MKSLIAATVVLLAYAVPAEACVTMVNRNGNVFIMNGCLYPVIVQFHGSSFGDGATGKIPPQGEEMIAVSPRDYVTYRYCNYNSWVDGSCRF